MKTKIFFISIISYIGKDEIRPLVQLIDFNRMSTRLVGGKPRGVASKVLDCDLEISKFELQSRSYSHFWTNAPWEVYETPSSSRAIG